MKNRNAKKVFKITVFFFLSMLPLMLAGCWNNKDLTDINIVSALGIERTEEGKILVTVQVVEPSAIQSTSSGKGKGGGTQLKPVFNVSYAGETVFEALRGMLSKVDKKLFLSTVQVLILGENLAREGIDKAIDFFLRDHEVGYKMDVLVAKDASPREILDVETEMESIQGMYIKGTIENTVSRGTAMRIMLIDLIKDMGSSGKQLVIGQIKKAGQKEVWTEGSAVFRDCKLVGWLDSYETRGYLFATGKVKSAIINIQVDRGKVAMEIIGSKGKVDVQFKNGKPAFLTIKVELEANVGEYDVKGKLELPDSLINLEKNLSEEVKREIKKALDRTQKDYASDIFGFGSYLHKYHPRYWEKVKGDWNDTFSRLPVNIEVDAKIRRIGLIKGPLNKDE